MVVMVPFLDRRVLKNELEKRNKKGAGIDDLIAGILPNKFTLALTETSGHINLDSLVDVLKNRHFDVVGTRGWNEAEFTAGGVDANEVNNEKLGARMQERIYLAGEILGVE